MDKGYKSKASDCENCRHYEVKDSEERCMWGRILKVLSGEPIGRCSLINYLSPLQRENVHKGKEELSEEERARNRAINLRQIVL